MGESHLRVEPIKEKNGLIQILSVSERIAKKRGVPSVHSTHLKSDMEYVETSIKDEVKWETVFIFTSLPV